MEKLFIQDEVNQFGVQDIIVDLLTSLSVVKNLSEINHQADDEKTLIKKALSVLIQNHDMERCSFFLLNEQGELVNLTGISIEESDGNQSVKNSITQRFKIGEGIIGIAAETGKLQHCQDCSQDERIMMSGKNGSSLPGSIVSVPVYIDINELVGVLNISHPQAYYFSEWHLRLLHIYKNMLGQLIANYRLFESMEQQIAIRTAKLENAMLDLQKLKEYYQNMSMIDQLTGLHNRHYFYDQAELALAHMRRYGRALCLLVLDLDHFKQVNDHYGHGFGDQVLIGASKALKKCMRESDILVRYGGEEFIVIFTNTDCEKGKIFAERIRATIEALTWEEDENFIQTVSIGLLCIDQSCCNQDDSDMNIDKLINSADKALYYAKEQGRNRIVVFNEDTL